MCTRQAITKCDSVTRFFMVAESRTKTDDEDMMKEQSEV